MRTIEAMAADYRKNNGFQINETELHIIITEFIVKMQLAAIEDGKYAESVSISEYYKKVKNAEVKKD